MVRSRGFSVVLTIIGLLIMLAVATIKAGTVVSGNTGTSAGDQSAPLAIQIQSSGELQSFLERGYRQTALEPERVSVTVNDVSCSRDGGAQRYSCIVGYDVRGASMGNGGYRLDATGVCSGTACTWDPKPVDTAVPTGL